MSGRRLAGVDFQPFLSFAIMLAAWFSPKALSSFRVAQFDADRFKSFLSCRCCHPGARTGRQRAVDLNRPGARPLMARPGWLPGRCGRCCPHRCGPLYSGGSGGLWAKRGRCGWRVLRIYGRHFHLYHISHCWKCPRQRCPSGWLLFWGSFPAQIRHWPWCRFRGLSLPTPGSYVAAWA